MDDRRARRWSNSPMLGPTTPKAPVKEPFRRTLESQIMTLTAATQQALSTLTTMVLITDRRLQFSAATYIQFIISTMVLPRAPTLSPWESCQLSIIHHRPNRQSSSLPLPAWQQRRPSLLHLNIPIPPGETRGLLAKKAYFPRETNNVTAGTLRRHKKKQ